MTDYDDFDNTSYRNNGQGLFLERESMEWFWNHYLPNPKVNGNNIYASPLKGEPASQLFYAGRHHNHRRV